MTNQLEIEKLLKNNSDPNETFPVFKDSDEIKVKVIFVLGGPGAGKGIST